MSSDLRAMKHETLPKHEILPPELQTPVPSPCISMCKMAPDTGLCQGCMRSIDEIIGWGAQSDDYKRAVWAEIRRREAALDFK